MGRRPKEENRSLAYFKFGGEQFAVLSVPVVPQLPAALTEAEREVAALVFAGKSNAEIARERSVALRTVANQVAAIMRKVGVGSRAALVAKLVEPET